MSKEELKKIIEVLCDVADRADMSDEEGKYYDMAIGLISLMVDRTTA